MEESEVVVFRRRGIGGDAVEEEDGAGKAVEAPLDVCQGRDAARDRALPRRRDSGRRRARAARRPRDARRLPRPRAVGPGRISAMRTRQITLHVVSRAAGQAQNLDVLNLDIAAGVMRADKQHIVIGNIRSSD